MSEVGQNESSSENLQRTAGKWSLPETCSVRKIDNLRAEHEPIDTQIVELPFTTQPGDRLVSTEFVLDVDPKDYDIITAGPHMWSQSTSVEKPSLSMHVLPTNRSVGARSYEESLQNPRYNYFEPGFDEEKKLSEKEGRSYGFVALRHKTTGEDLMLGTIPQLDTFERISFSMKDGKFAVSVQKDFEGITTARESTFKVFLGSADPKKGQGKYADLLEMYGQELARIKSDVPLLKNNIIGFSYPTYSGDVNQTIIEQEIEAGRGIIDTYIIDYGWNKPNDDPHQVDIRKFPDLPGLAQKMKDVGIRPGIWVAPFEVKNPKNIPNSLRTLKDDEGKPAKSPFPIREDYGIKALPEMLMGKNPGSLDISLPAVREYITQHFVDLAEMGFEVFKLDFLSRAFAGRMSNNDKTSIEYYRQTIQEIRETVRKKTGKEIILIGCGGPWMESLGLFNGLRMTNDSAFPLPADNIPGKIQDKMVNQKVNPYLYKDAVAVAARRVIPFGESFGMILDGIHIDPNVPLGNERKGAYNESLLALRKLGISNMFVGDSLINLPDDIRQQWINYVQTFKDSNYEA